MVTIAYVLNDLEVRNPCMKSKVNMLAKGHGYSAACLRKDTIREHNSHPQGGALIDITHAILVVFETAGFGSLAFL